MNVDFTTAAELLAICKKEVISPGEAMLRREERLTGASRDEIREIGRASCRERV